MSAAASQCLVAWGSQLRGDDGAAWELARRAAEAGWVTFTSIQLLPELCEELQFFDVVVFADASQGQHGLQLSEIGPESADTWPLHCGRPEQLLSLCARLYGRAPRALMLNLPGENFDLGFGLSARARASVEEGWSRLADLGHMLTPEPGAKVKP